MARAKRPGTPLRTYQAFYTSELIELSRYSLVSLVRGQLMKETRIIMDRR